MGSTFRIVPLYRGLNILNDSEIVHAIEDVSQENDTWVTINDIYYDSLPLNAGRRSLTGVQIYTDLDFWRQVGGEQYDIFYNREGHYVFTDDPSLTEPFRLLQPNYLQIKFQCSDFTKRNIQFALASHPMQQPCIHLVDTVYYPMHTFYLYKIQ